MSEEEMIVNIMTKLLNIADTYLGYYCENFDEYVLSEEDIEEIEDEEEKEKAIDLKETDDFLKRANEFIKEYKKEKNINNEQEENEEESI